MSTQRSATNTFWSTITSLVDGELVTMELLYARALHRLQDNAYFVLGKVSEHIADLASTAAGGHANIVGNVDLTAFNFNSGIALNGLTIIVDEDANPAQTCTFDNTITTPALMLAALNSQAGTNITWSLTSSGFLYAKSNTVGSGSTMAAPTGTAATALFGSATTTSPGSSTVNDGASRIGLAAIGSISWAGGDMRTFITGTLAPLLSSLVVDVSNKVAKAGDTMTGTLTAPLVTINNASNTVAIASRSKTVTDGSPMSVDQTNWVATSSAEVGALVNTAVTLPIEIYPVDGSVLTAVSVYWQGAGGHGALPATMPTVEVYQEALASGTTTQLGSTATDTSANTTAYQTRHPITVSSINHAVDRTNNRYYVLVTNEGGANALSGATYKGIKRTSTYTRLDEG